jgi:zinc protease
MKLAVAVLLAALTASVPALWAADQRVATAAPAIVEAPVLASRIMANGLEVIVFEDHSVPIVTTELVVRNGSFTETPELNGLSHLYEHMFFKGNQAMVNREPYTLSLGEMGITYNARTAEEAVTYYLTTTTPNYPVALRYLRDSALYPVFDPELFAQEIEVVVAEIDRQESNPYSALISETTKGLFFRYPSRKTPAGSRQTVRAATTAAMRLIQERYYVPNNSAVIITGDVTPQAAFAQAEELFGDWKRRAVDPFVEFPLAEHPPLERSTGRVLTGPIQGVVVQIGWHGPSIGKDDAATYAADVFSWLLRQPQSRFQRALVDSGLTSAVGLNYFTQRNVGPITLMLQTTPEQVRPALRAVYAEIARFNDPDYFTDEELDSARTGLEAEDLFDREKASEYAHSIAFWWSSTNTDYFRGYLGRLRATSRADIARYVSNYIHGKPHLGVALLSEAGAKSSGLTSSDLIGASASGGR